MRKIITLLLFLCFVSGTSANNVFSTSLSYQNTTLNFLIIPQSQIVPVKAVEKKMKLKERILFRFFQKQMLRKTDEAGQKKLINRLGLFSVISSVLGLVSVLSIFFLGGIGYFISIFFLLTALILGLVALNKRKKLSDKTGVSKTLPWVGIILSVLGLAFIFIALLSDLTDAGW